MSYEDIVAAAQRRDAKTTAKGKVKRTGVKGSGEQCMEFNDQDSSTKSAEMGEDPGVTRAQRQKVVMEQQKGEEEITRLGLSGWCHVFPVSEGHD